MKSFSALHIQNSYRLDHPRQVLTRNNYNVRQSNGALQLLPPVPLRSCHWTTQPVRRNRGAILRTTTQ